TLGFVVEGDHPIVKTDCEIRQLEVIKPRPRQLFEMMSELISKHAGDAALEGRQTGEGFHLKSTQIVRKDVKRIRRCARPAFPGYDCFPPACSNPEERIGRNERITNKRRVFLSAIKEYDMRQAL